MKLVTNVLGTFVLKDGRIIERVLFSRDPKEIADHLEEIESGCCEAEIQLINKLKKDGISKLEVKNPRRFYSYKSSMDKTDMDEPGMDKSGMDRPSMEFVEDKSPTDLNDIAKQIGVFKAEARELVHSANLELTKKRLRMLEKDQLVIHAINSIDKLDDAINELTEGLQEWYSLHFPELLVNDPEEYVRLVHDLGRRENFDPVTFGGTEDSMGVALSDPDIEVIKSFSRSILELYSSRKQIEDYTKKMMEDIAPNISALSGEMLGARLIASAGSLRRLSRLPASTIQLLGAESALFRFLKTKKKPPKHGMIFQLPEIHSSPKKIRGKIARMFAAKFAIAAKIDSFGGEFIGDKLREDFLKKVEVLRG